MNTREMATRHGLVTAALLAMGDMWEEHLEPWASDDERLAFCELRATVRALDPDQAASTTHA